jgi:hypothetical protein
MPTTCHFAAGGINHLGNAQNFLPSTCLTF